MYKEGAVAKWVIESTVLHGERYTVHWAVFCQL